MRIPRYGPPKRSAGVPSISIGDLVAPYKAAADLAETATEAVTRPALAILDKQLEEANKARKLAFQAEAARDTAGLVNDINSRITALAEVGDSAGIHRFFTDELDGIIEGRSARYQNESERNEIKTQLIETGASMYSHAVKEATVADLANAKRGYLNAYADVLDAVRSGVLSLSDAHSELSNLSMWARGGNLISNEDAARDIDAGFKEASKLSVAGAIDRAQAVSSTDYNQAIRIIDEAIKTVPPQVDPSMTDWARGELGQYRSNLVKARNEQASQSEKIQISNAVRDIEDGRRLGKPAVVERGLKELDRIKEKAVDPDNRLKAAGWRSNFEVDGAMETAEAIYHDTKRAEAAIAGGAPVTFENPATAQKMLNNAIRQRREALGPVANTPSALAMDATNAMLNNTQGIIPSEAVKNIGQLTTTARTDPNAMQILVRTMDEIGAAPPVLSQLQKTPEGRDAYRVAKAYKQAYQSALASAGGDVKAPEIAARSAFQKASAVAAAPLKGAEEFETQEKKRLAYADSDEWAEEYSALYEGGWLIDSDFEKAVKNATGMSEEEFSAFIGPESRFGTNPLVHEDLLQTTKRMWVDLTPMGETADQNSIASALELAVGDVMNRWRWTPSGFMRGNALQNTPTLQVGRDKMNAIFDEVRADGKLTDADRERFVSQDGFTIIGDDKSGYAVIQPGVMLAPLWQSTAAELNKRIAERQRIKATSDAMLKEAKARFGENLAGDETPEVIVRGGE